MLEARPLAGSLGLRAHGGGPFPAFRNERLLLVVTGTGIRRAAAATGWAFGRFPGIESAVNIGFCGAAESVSPVHRWHYISSIRDAGGGRLSIPDILWRHPFPEAALRTVPAPASGDDGWEGLIDMEGSGFFEAARAFIGPDRIALLKWVSDHLSETLDREAVAMAYGNTLDPVLSFIRDWPAGEKEDAEHEDPLVGEILRRLRLTETQVHYLRDWIGGYLDRGGSPERLLTIIPAKIPDSKTANKALFAALKDVLKS